MSWWLKCFEEQVAVHPADASQDSQRPEFSHAPLLPALSQQRANFLRWYAPLPVFGVQYVTAGHFELGGVQKVDWVWHEVYNCTMYTLNPQNIPEVEVTGCLTQVLPFEPRIIWRSSAGSMIERSLWCFFSTRVSYDYERNRCLRITVFLSDKCETLKTCSLKSLRIAWCKS